MKRKMLTPILTIALVAVCLDDPARAESRAIIVETPMQPPAWALLERELLHANAQAADAFARKYLDEQGELLHVMRWGTLDGPDDAIETFRYWPLLHALGAPNHIRDTFAKAIEGHYRQYGRLRTERTELAKNGAYFKEFITMSDWIHTGEGIRGYLFYGLSNPYDPLYGKRMRRFAGLYMNEDPGAPNYNPQHKLIRSLWTGSKGPMLRRATQEDWVGDPTPGHFHVLHSAAGRAEMIDLEANYQDMLNHCEEYLHSVGDHPLNLGATGLALHAYMLGHEPKYKDWLLEYADAWKERIEQNGGNIPTNIGLDGTIGGEFDGKWYKGTYGWNFSVWSPEHKTIGHRNNFEKASWPGFANALLVSGDLGYIDVLRRQMDNIYAEKKTADGKLMVPHMYGDAGWYHWTTDLFLPRIMDIYMWSMKPRDRQRLPEKGWLAFLEGQDKGYPVRALQEDFSRVRHKMEDMRNDPTTPDTRLADWTTGAQPVQINSLLELMLGAYLNSRVWGGLHARVRYFDPVARRPGLPQDIAGLVDRMTADETTLTLVNINPVEPRTLVVQMGAYGEHQCQRVILDQDTIDVGRPFVSVRLEPGAGARMTFEIERYTNEPSLAFPWDRHSTPMASP